MLTVIDIINRVLGYFNIADKPKGKAFTWIAFVANFYLLYIAIQNLRYPDFRIRGALFMLAFVVFLYFIALNFLYYFTNKTTRFDISPTVENWLLGFLSHATNRFVIKPLIIQTQDSLFDQTGN